jgi:hypothetical protein
VGALEAASTCQSGRPKKAYTYDPRPQAAANRQSRARRNPGEREKQGQHVGQALGIPCWDKLAGGRPAKSASNGMARKSRDPAQERVPDNVHHALRPCKVKSSQIHADRPQILQKPSPGKQISQGSERRFVPARTKSF